MTDTNQKLREALHGAVAELEDVLRNIAKHKVHIDGDEFHERLSKARQALAMPTAVQPRIRIPTDAMEQEFQNHYRRGFEAGKRAALLTAAPVDERAKHAPIFAWCIESKNSADWAWSATLDGVKSNAQFLDEGSDPGEPFAVVRLSDHIASLQSGADAVLAEREACAKVCEAERLTDDTNDPTDNAYNLAVEHCVMAIRARETIARGKGE